MNRFGKIVFLICIVFSGLSGSALAQSSDDEQLCGTISVEAVYGLEKNGSFAFAPFSFVPVPKRRPFNKDGYHFILNSDEGGKHIIEADFERSMCCTREEAKPIELREKLAVRSALSGNYRICFPYKKWYIYRNEWPYFGNDFEILDRNISLEGHKDIFDLDLLKALRLKCYNSEAEDDYTCDYESFEEEMKERYRALEDNKSIWVGRVDPPVEKARKHVEESNRIRKRKDAELITNKYK
ncbi:MAG: hypothetical protein KDD52_01075 [Bdellovibrionales bacterium]|nr:hypothetical protein [Bdellovibrionales bacterium]